MKNVFARTLSFVIVGFSALVLLSACTKKDSAEKANKKVHLAIWSNYVTPEMLAEFKSKSGFEVEVSNYSSNEELLAKLQAGASGIDVAVPSDYMVSTMIELGLLESLQLEKVSHFADLDKNLVAQYFDPQNQFSVPFSWGTTGIAVNTSLFKGEVNSWKDLFSNPAAEGKFSLLDDVRETLGAALKSAGKSLNSTDEKDLAAAKELLMTTRSKVRAFSSETYPGLVSGDLPIAHAYSVDALHARATTKGSIRYVIPAEGATRWIDNVVIPRGSKNKEGALALINFLVSPEVGAQRTKLFFSAPSNKKSLDLLPAELKKDPALFPPSDVLARTEMIRELGESLSLWDRSWTEVRASR
jgi:spermidine/putrescine transport system substrate-binding protein